VPRPKKTNRDAEAAYERNRIAAAETSRQKSVAGREISPLPRVKNPARRAACAESLAKYCRTYHPEVFYLDWSDDQLRALQRVETATRRGGLFAYAMPRGGGKSSIAECGAEWGMLYGYLEFALLIGAEQDGALESLDSIKTGFETNDLLFEDFPEVCYPIRRLDGIAHRANGQLFNGKRTYITWTASEIVLPTIPESKASSAILAVTGITGRIRGMKFKRPSDGRIVRPGLVIADDPQTAESARSPSQCETRLRMLRADIMGLAGPGKKISVIMPCTVIRAGDVADTLTDGTKHPEWQGERTKLVYQFPTNPHLWEEYKALRKQGRRQGRGPGGDGVLPTEPSRRWTRARKSPGRAGSTTTS
jgi:hypothetical protein